MGYGEHLLHLSCITAGSRQCDSLLGTVLCRMVLQTTARLCLLPTRRLAAMVASVKDLTGTFLFVTDWIVICINKVQNLLNVIDVSSYFYASLNKMDFLLLCHAADHRWVFLFSIFCSSEMIFLPLLIISTYCFSWAAFGEVRTCCRYACGREMQAGLLCPVLALPYFCKFHLGTEMEVFISEIIYVVAHMFWTQLDLMRFPERRKGEQLFQEHTSFPIPHHPTIHTYAFCLHYNFYPSLKLSISIWINVFLQVSYIRGSILLPSRQAVPGIILSLNILWAVQVILQLFSSANLDSSHDVSRFEGYPLQWINISYAITTVPMVERNLSYLKLSFKTSQK